MADFFNEDPFFIEDPIEVSSNDSGSNSNTETDSPPLPSRQRTSTPTPPPKKASKTKSKITTSTKAIPKPATPATSDSDFIPWDRVFTRLRRCSPGDRLIIRWRYAGEKIQRSWRGKVTSLETNGVGIVWDAGLPQFKGNLVAPLWPDPAEMVDFEVTSLDMTSSDVPPVTEVPELKIRKRQRSPATESNTKDTFLRAAHNDLVSKLQVRLENLDQRLEESCQFRESSDKTPLVELLELTRGETFKTRRSLAPGLSIVDEVGDSYSSFNLSELLKVSPTEWSFGLAHTLQLHGISMATVPNPARLRLNASRLTMMAWLSTKPTALNTKLCWLLPFRLMTEVITAAVALTNDSQVAEKTRTDFEEQYQAGVIDTSKILSKIFCGRATGARSASSAKSHRSTTSNVCSLCGRHFTGPWRNHKPKCPKADKRDSKSDKRNKE
jgi:hypothetical protein